MSIEIEDVSPLAALIKGKGAGGGLPIVGAINKYRDKRKARKEEDKLAEEEKKNQLTILAGETVGAKPMANKVGMSKGGVAKKKIDGAALRGKTKGRMY